MSAIIIRINQYKLVGSVKICVETNKRTTNQIKIFNIIIKSFILFLLPFDDLIVAPIQLFVKGFLKNFSAPGSFCNKAMSVVITDHGRRS